MPILKDKKIVFISDESEAYSDLLTIFKKTGTQCIILSYEQAQTGVVSIDAHIFLLDHCSPTGVCGVILDLLRKTSIHDHTPIIAIIEKPNTDLIDDVLVRGATDYATKYESVDTFLQKIRLALGIPSNFVGTTAIDISDPISSDQASISGNGLRVFVVEDDPLLRNLLTHKFEQSNIPFVFNNDGMRVPEQMQQFKPTVLILDLMLPGKSGFDVLTEIQSISSLQDIPVVVFSNRDNPEDRQRAKALGVTSFSVKAVTSLSELVQTLYDCTEKK